VPKRLALLLFNINFVGVYVQYDLYYFLASGVKTCIFVSVMKELDWLILAAR
jgi:hypothetical protein